jgi:hypothetical protein
LDAIRQLPDEVSLQKIAEKIEFLRQSTNSTARVLRGRHRIPWSKPLKDFA